jgi:hypothetical protein
MYNPSGQMVLILNRPIKDCHAAGEHEAAYLTEYVYNSTNITSRRLHLVEKNVLTESMKITTLNAHIKKQRSPIDNVDSDDTLSLGTRHCKQPR